MTIMLQMSTEDEQLFVDDCQLCCAKKLSTQYYETSRYWIAKCVSCNCPIIVCVEHVTNVEQALIDEILLVCNKIFDMSKFDIDFKMKTMDNHFHFHLRPKVKKETENMVEEVKVDVVSEGVATYAKKKTHSKKQKE